MSTPWHEVATTDLQVQRIEVDGAGPVAVLTLDLPQRRNMMSEGMTASWGAVIRALGEDPELRAVVVTGTPPAFCSGGDTSWIGAESHLGIEGLRARMARFYRVWMAITELRVPTLAAVNGPAIGAGLALAMACDIRYVSEDAVLAAPFTRLGMHPGMLTTWSLTRAASLSVARDLLLTGRRVGGQEAVTLGLASRCLPPGELMPAALEAAHAIAGSAPMATRLTKQALAGDGPVSYEAALQWEALAQAVTLASDDLQEGLAAQRERRTPRFTGR